MVDILNKPLFFDSDQLNACNLISHLNLNFSKSIITNIIRKLFIMNIVDYNVQIAAVQ